MQSLPQRISVVGTTGSGKTTFAQKLSQCLEIPHFELDAIHWQENWEPLPVEKFRTQVSKVLTQEAWVIDGNYRKVRDLIWKRADTVVWLDYSLPRILCQLLQRTFRRVLTHEELWNENREHFRSQFLSRDSLFLWAIKTYPKRKNLYPELFDQPKYHHLHIVHLVSPKTRDKWLDELEVYHP
jgi:adenylate kinase family enzyme